MQRSEQVNELALALAKAQGLIHPAEKDKVNPHFRSHYSTLAAVIDACKEPLSNNGLSFVQAIIESSDNRWHLETMLMHSSGQWVSSLTPLLVDKDNMQGLGSAISYAKRYALAAMVGVASDEDDDGNAATGRAGQQPPKSSSEQTSEIPSSKSGSAKPSTSSSSKTNEGGPPHSTCGRPMMSSKFPNKETGKIDWYCVTCKKSVPKDEPKAAPAPTQATQDQIPFTEDDIPF